MSDVKRVDTISNRLREALKDSGKKQIDIVRETGINRSAISRYLSGGYEPKSTRIYDLAKVLDVSEQWLMGYDCEKKRPEEQKNNDAKSDIIVRMRIDNDFFRIAEKINSDDEFYSLVKTLSLLDDSSIRSLKAFTENLIKQV